MLLGLEYSQTQEPTVKKLAKVGHKSALLGGGSWLSAIGTGWRQLSLMEDSQVQAGWVYLGKGPCAAGSIAAGRRELLGPGLEMFSLGM